MLACTSFQTSPMLLRQIFGKKGLSGQSLHKFSLGLVNRHKSTKSAELVQTKKLTLISIHCLHPSTLPQEGR